MTHTSFLGVKAMAINRKQLPYLLLLAASACFLLNAKYSWNGVGNINRITSLETDGGYGQILPDGTLFIPVGDTSTRSQG